MCSDRGELLFPAYSVCGTPDDASDIRSYVEEKKCRRAVVCGAGFIGLEVAENLMAQGLEVTVIDAASQITPNAFDKEMAAFARKQLKAAGMRVLTSTTLNGIEGEGKAEKVITGNGTLAADIVIVAIGVRPATGFLADSRTGNVQRYHTLQDAQMKTNLPDVYAAGDCAMVKNAITGQPQWSAMGSTANLAARAMAKAMYGKGKGYGGWPGNRKSSVCFQLLTEAVPVLRKRQAKAAGYETSSVICVVDDKAHYYPGASSFVVKLIAETATRKLLGIQVLGAGAVDR